MIANELCTEWEASLKEFCTRNWLRRTRLFYVDATGTRTSERGLPLNGLNLGVDPDGSLQVVILLGGHKTGDTRHLTRTLSGVRRITHSSPPNCCDTLEIEQESGARTILDFGPLTGLGDN